MEFVLEFLDGSTTEIEAADFPEAWVKGKIEAQNRKTYLFHIRVR